MKLKLFFFLIIISTTAKAQIKKDTLYINKNVNQVIFIDTPHSKFHDLVFNILLADIQQNETNKKDMNLSDNLYSNYLGQWITVKKLRHKYFAYYPSEPYYNTFFKLSDSTLLINDFNDGFVLYTIKNKKETKKEANFELMGYEGVRHSLYIKHKTKTIFMVKSSLFNVNKAYFVKRSNYYNFPIIVNYCPTNRCQEFNFK
jgi:hypothetical protein